MGEKFEIELRISFKSTMLAAYDAENRDIFRYISLVLIKVDTLDIQVLSISIVFISVLTLF